MEIARRVRTAIARMKPLQRSIGKAIDVPGLPRSPRQVGSVWAVTMARDEADVVGHTIGHLLEQGVDGIIAVDNLSKDETPLVLASLAAQDDRVFVGTDTLPAFHQGRKVSHLANLARRAGAEWVILFDADEFWFARGRSVADELRAIQGATVARCAVHDGHAKSIEGIDLNDPGLQVRVDDAPAMTKVAIRPDGWVWVNDGNHEAADLPGERVDGLFALHLPRRTPEQFTRKVTQGASAIGMATGVPDHFALHWREAASAGADWRKAAWLEETTAVGDLRPHPAAWGTWSLGSDEALRRNTTSRRSDTLGDT